MPIITESQEQARLAQLREMADQGIGAVSLLSYETATISKMNTAKRLRSTLAALRQIEADPANAKNVAAAAIAADDESI